MLLDGDLHLFVTRLDAILVDIEKAVCEMIYFLVEHPQKLENADALEKDTAEAAMNEESNYAEIEEPIEDPGRQPSHADTPD